MLSRQILRSVISLPSRILSSTYSTPTTSTTKTVDDIEFEDLEEVIEEVQSKIRDENVSFAKLLRNSKFVQLGNFDGRMVIGKVVHRVNDDLYIDFGLKFNAVCTAPNDGNKYTVGSKVLIRLHDPELSEKFLGSKHDLTLLEADATLVKLLGVSGQKRKQEGVQQNQA